MPFHGACVCVAQHLGVQPLLVAEVVIDRRDVRPGAPADLPHGGRAIPLGCKHFPRGLQQPVMRALILSAFKIAFDFLHSIASLKQLFEMVKSALDRFGNALPRISSYFSSYT